MKRFITLEHIQTLGGKKIESITSFNDIIIVNDDGAQPERLIWFLKTLTEYESHQLLAVSDHEGSISFLWSDVPPKYQKIRDIGMPDGDIWSVYKNYNLDHDNLMRE
ncbi:MAG: hypothetical protein J7623_28490 [Chitinophaga sp.]|uniref:hypothetical protein n=1 Tax=Chitinophaga sp. TaxID=1869181 RepID=UPI001B19F45B|nr:hypothetical protein [Chitinophaga sp.]MBO9732615.1 hypothetical protein [Chitinophaga sp.]